MADLQHLPMVGVARIELATPTMSTQGQYPKTADFRHFDVPNRANKPETGREHGAVSPQFHRTPRALSSRGAA